MPESINENQNKKQRLGRGLGSLLGGSADALNITEMPGPTRQEALREEPQAPAEARVWQVGVDKLTASNFQPRTHFEKEKLAELAASIKQNGILQPIVARKLANGKLEIVAGERRWRAAQQAGLHEVPVIIKTMNDQNALEMAIIENIQREDLNAIEEAEAYQRLANEFKLTQQQVADKVGKERATVANAMRLLLLPKTIREMVQKNEISAGHAKALLSLSSAQQQMEFAKKAVQQKMSVRNLERLVAAESAEKKEGSILKKDGMENNVTQRLISGLAEELQKIMGTKVSIDYMNAKGKIAIHFYSDEELTQIVDRLKESHGKH